MSGPWLSADDVPAHLGVTKDTVHSWISYKSMPAHKVGRLWKIQASEVDAWVRSGGATLSAETSLPVDWPMSAKRGAGRINSMIDFIHPRRGGAHNDGHAT